MCLSAHGIFSALYKWVNFDINQFHINKQNSFVTVIKCALNGRLKYLIEFLYYSFKT